RLAQPVIERLREPYPVPRFGHFRAAGERVAGAVDLLGKLVRRRPSGRACEKASHHGNVRGGLARIDLAQRLISALSRRAAPGWFGLVDLPGFNDSVSALGLARNRGARSRRLTLSRRSSGSTLLRDR